jgi:Family of unknown function (DUF6166)
MVNNGWTGRYTRAHWFEVWLNGVPLDLTASLAVRIHSPTGPAWGYGGSGPAQLALAILLEEIGQPRAELYYQDFKRRVLAGLPCEEGAQWTFSSAFVRAWVADYEKELQSEAAWLKERSLRNDG